MEEERLEKKEDIERAVRRIQEMIDRLRVAEAAIKSSSDTESLLVGGEWLKLGASFPVVSFYNEKLADVSLAEREMLKAAIDHAYASRDLFSEMPLADRAGVLLSFLRAFSAKKEELARLNSKVTGVPIKHSLEQADDASELFGEIARQAIPGEQRTFYDHGKQKMVVEESAGVLAAFVYSDSALLDASILVAVSVATLTPLVLLPSKRNSLLLLRLGKIALDSGVPPALISVVCGEEEDFVKETAENRKAATVLYSGPEKGAEAFGSVAGRSLKKMHVETPKKDMFVVCEDCSMDRAADGLARHLARRQYPVVAFVEYGIFDAFASIVEDKIKGLEKGDPMSPRADFRVFSDEELAGFRAGVNAVGKNRRLGVQVDRHFMPAIYGGGEFDGDLVRAVRDFPAVVMFRSTSLGYALHYARNIRVKNASIYTNSMQNAFSAVRDLNAETVSVNSRPVAGYEEWMGLAARKKRINLGGVGLQ